MRRDDVHELPTTPALPPQTAPEAPASRIALVLGALALLSTMLTDCTEPQARPAAARQTTAEVRP
ncbi:hypothetical protein [Chitinimonas koreensis]|uniref:hypothetical protein n=1 Tax=Chitinimonas koreensis TaxID=356302 RepID=UPI000425F8B0|nr:hypothetical protein [Chitinimonas koreensis]QNM94925.1 hypothetical protein H9L41_13445 [Chitinimonas koreensis]